MILRIITRDQQLYTWKYTFTESPAKISFIKWFIKREEDEYKSRLFYESVSKSGGLEWFKNTETTTSIDTFTMKTIWIAQKGSFERKHLTEMVIIIKNILGGCWCTNAMADEMQMKMTIEANFVPKFSSSWRLANRVTNKQTVWLEWRHLMEW